MQLLAFGGCSDTAAVIEAVKASGLEAVVYEDVNDAHGIGLLTMAEDPAFFTGPLRELLQQQPFASLTPKPEFTMLGRTYSLGYEPDLDEVLLQRPRHHSRNADWPWVIFYPLRRSGKFTQLPHEDQMAILREHGVIGMSYGAADYGHDIRLACHGLDKNDNDFVIGLIGKELAPLSILVQTMRKTQQTSLYLEQLGPFFVGKAVWQAPLSG